MRRKICIRRMFAPWEIAWDQTLPISLPTCGHDSQANELPAARQACLTACPMGPCHPPPTASVSPRSGQQVPRPVPIGCIASSGGTGRWEPSGKVTPSPGPPQRIDHAAQSDERPRGPPVLGHIGSSPGCLEQACSAVAGTSAKAIPQGGPGHPASSTGQEQEPLSTSEGVPGSGLVPLSDREAVGCGQGLNVQRAAAFPAG